MDLGEFVLLDSTGIGRLLEVLADRGYRTLGPVVRDEAIVPGEISSTDDLPSGWHDTQAPGSYRLRHGTDAELFGWAVGPQSWKSILLPSSSVLWRARREEGSVVVEEDEAPVLPSAVIGARPCELAGISLLDRVLLGGTFVDPHYAKRRADAFIVVAECGAPSSSCFCTSMATGPDARGRYDLALSELPGGTPRGQRVDDEAQVRLDSASRFLVRAGTVVGLSVLEELGGRPAGADDLHDRDAMLEAARSRMERVLDTTDLPALLARNVGNPRWEEVARRCLACGNCTMVCPSCFCVDVDDVSDLNGTIERRRSWASCFDLEHSNLHGGPVRASTASRYRQWATHKLSTWHDQFDSSGCVGCGRCITWCPVGIDITEEVAAIRHSEGRALLGAQAGGDAS